MSCLCRIAVGLQELLMDCHKGGINQNADLHEGRQGPQSYGGGGYLAPKSETETWVLIESPDLSSTFDYIINFKSNDIKFVQMKSFGTLGPGTVNHNLIYYNAAGTAIPAYYGEFDRWPNDAYRTITFLEPPTGDLLTWLQANGTKQ